MVAFDDSSYEMNNTPFEQRYHSLLDSLPLDHPAVVSTFVIS